MSEIIFVVQESQDGGYFAKALGEGIVTQGDTLEELKEMIRDAVKCHFEENNLPKIVHLHLTREETFAL
jgi:predicted RNase H-like HicB family nuclease